MNIFRILYDPSRAFNALNERPKWVLAFNLVMIFTVLSSVILTHFVFIPNRHELYLSNNFTEDEIEKAEEQLQGPMIYLLNILAPFLYVVIGFVVTALFFYLFFPVIGYDVAFKKTFAVITNSALMRIPAFIIKTPLMIIKGTLAVNTGLLLFLPFVKEKTFLHTFLAKFDFFTVWEVILLGIGFSTISKLKKKFTLLIVFGAWIILNLISTFLPITGR